MNPELNCEQPEPGEAQLIVEMVMRAEEAEHPCSTAFVGPLPLPFCSRAVLRVSYQQGFARNVPTEDAPNGAERTRAALALGLLKAWEAVPGLAALLGTGDPGAQRVAAEALAAISTPAAIAALMAPLADPQLMSAQHAAMGGWRWPASPPWGR